MSPQPKFSPEALLLYAICSSIISWMCLQGIVGVIFLLPGYFCAQVTLFGIIAGMVGRHWLHGMALSMGLQTVICALAFALESTNENGGLISYLTGKPFSSSIILQYSVLTVVLPAIPSLLMRKLQSWRLVIDPKPHKSNNIQGLLVATTFVAMITASAIKSYIPAIDYSMVFGVLGACTVTFYLPVVRMSLEESFATGSSQDGATFSPRPKAEVVAYSLLLGFAGMVLLTPFKPLVALWIGLQYAIFIVCLWIGIWCLGASGLRFRSQSMDHHDQSLRGESESESKTVATGVPDGVPSPFSDDTFETRQNAREPVEVLGRWSLVIVAALIAGFTLVRIWARQR